MPQCAGVADLIGSPPGELVVGGGTALFVEGRFMDPGGRPLSLRMVCGGVETPLMGSGMAPPRTRRGEGYWWGIARIPALEPGVAESQLELGLRATLASGDVCEVDLAEVPLRAELAGPAVEVPAASSAGDGAADAGPAVAICMATYQPDPRFFRRQIESIRAQTHENWVCFVSDDASDDAIFESMRAVLGDDPRFVLSRASENRGFYANFERALSMTPPDVELVALSDQDDHWYEDKLASLIDGLEPSAGLVYSDMRIVDEEGASISDTYWTFRRNNHTDYASLVLANTVTGAASLFRRELLDDVLPFPPRLGNAFHDHWIAQVAMSLGTISYVDRPLYDYVQHGEAAIGYLSANGSGRYSGSLLSRGRISAQRLRERRWHLGWRVPYFKLYCRTALSSAVLELRCGPRMDPRKLELIRTLQDPARAARWLIPRSMRNGLRTTETLGRERVMLAGLAWYGLERLRRRVLRSG